MIREKSIFKSLCLVILTLMLFLYAATLFAAEVTLSWDPPTTNEDFTTLNDLGGFIIYLGTAPGSYSQSIDVGDVTSYNVNELNGGMNYYFAITAYNITGFESGYSGEISEYVESIDTAPPVISGVYADSITSSSAVVNWTTNEASDSQIEYGTTLSFGNTTSVDSSLVTTHSQSISLAPSTQYYYRVFSRDDSGNLSVSGNYTFTSADQVELTPPVISNIQVTNITPSSATISWTTDEAATSQVEYGLDTNYRTSTYNDPNLVTIHSVDIAGLLSYTEYDFRVISMDASYNEAQSGNYTFMTSNLPPKINAVSADPDTGFAALMANFSSASSDEDGFIAKHEWDYDGDGSYDEDTGAITSTSVIYAEAGAYNARLRVTDNGGATAVSSIVTVTVDALLNQPPVISSVNATPSSGRPPLTVVLSADASDPDGTIMQYEWDFDGNGIYDAVVTLNPITYVYTSAGNYPARVRVTDNNGSTATGEVVVHVRKGKGNGPGGGNGKGKNR
jgi:PKD repeat protein